MIRLSPTASVGWQQAAEQAQQRGPPWFDHGGKYVRSGSGQSGPGRLQHLLLHRCAPRLLLGIWRSVEEGLCAVLRG